MNAGQFPVPFFSHLWNKIKGVVTSRKFWAAVGATVVLFTTDGISATQLVNGLVTIWSVFIASSAVEDGLKAYRG